MRCPRCGEEITGPLLEGCPACGADPGALHDLLGDPARARTPAGILWYGAAAAGFAVIAWWAGWPVVAYVSAGVAVVLLLIGAVGRGVEVGSRASRDE